MILCITHTLPYAKCYFAECHILFIFMLNDVLSSAIMFDVTVLNAVMLSLVADLFMANDICNNFPSFVLSYINISKVPLQNNQTYQRSLWLPWLIRHHYKWVKIVIFAEASIDTVTDISYNDLLMLDRGLVWFELSDRVKPSFLE